MNLRKSRFSSKSKRKSSFKDINSPVKKGSKPARSVKNTKNLSRQSLKTPAKHQKSALDDTLMINSSPKLHLITSTPISHDVRKRISRSSNDSSKKVERKSFNRISSFVISSPIQKRSNLLRLCEVQLIPVLPRGKRYSDQTKVDQILKKKYSLRNSNVYQKKLYCTKTIKDKKKPSSNAENLTSPLTSENFTPNIKVSKGNNKSNKIELSRHSESSCSSLSENEIEISKSSRNNLKLQTQSLSKRTSARLSSKTSLQSQETKTSKSLLKSVHNDLEQSIDGLRSGKVKLSSKAIVNKLYPKSSKKISAEKPKVAKKNYQNEIPKVHKTISSSSKKQTPKKSTETRVSQDSLLQSVSATDICTSYKYSLRNSNVHQEKLHCKKKMKDKRKSSSNAENLMSPSTSENFTPNLKVSKGNDKSNKIELSRHSESSCSSLSENEMEISKSPRNRLQTQSLSKRTSARLSSRSLSVTNNSTSYKYSLRNSNVHPEVLHCKKMMKDKRKSSSNAENLMSPSTSENFASDLKVSKGNDKSNKIELSQHSESSSSLSENEMEISKSPRNRLQTQSLSKKTSARLSSKTSLQSQETKTSKSLLKSVDNDLEQSVDDLRSGKIKLSSKAPVNKLYLNSSKKTLAKKPKVANKNDKNEIPKACKKVSSSSKKQTSSKKSTETQDSQDENFHHNYLTPKACKKISSSSKKQTSSKKSTETQDSQDENFHHDYLSLSADVVTIDDLSLAFKAPAKRKVKSDGFKMPGKNTLKRKRYAIDAVIKADEDYEDDLYESRDFQKFKDILLDTSDSERSFSISTPKFPVTPMMRHKTPKFKDDIISPTEYAMKRKVAMELNHIRQKRKSKESGTTVGNTPETPVLAEKKKLEYSQIIADAQKLQKTIESLVEDESDNDSYFSFN